MSVIYRRDLAISSLAFWSRSLALIVHHVRYIKILTRLRGFLVISLYLVWFSLCSSLFWQLRNNEVLKNLTLNVMLHETIRNDQFLAQHSVATLLRHCFEWLEHCSSIATLCCSKNRRCESSRPRSQYRTWAVEKEGLSSIMN